MEMYGVCQQVVVRRVVGDWRAAGTACSGLAVGRGATWEGVRVGDRCSCSVYDLSTAMYCTPLRSGICLRSEDKEGHRYAEMSKKGVSVHFVIFSAPGRSLPAKVSKRSLTLLTEIFAQGPARWGPRA